MTRQLATLLGAGIPLVQCLDSLVAQTRNSVLKNKDGSPLVEGVKITGVI